MCSFSCRKLETCQDAFLNSGLAPHWSRRTGLWVALAPYHSEVRKSVAVVKLGGRVSTCWALSWWWRFIEEAEWICGIGGTLSGVPWMSAHLLYILKLVCPSDGWLGQVTRSTGVGSCWKEPWKQCHGCRIRNTESETLFWSFLTVWLSASVLKFLMLHFFCVNGDNNTLKSSE